MPYSEITLKEGLYASLELQNMTGARTLLFDSTGDLLILTRGLNKVMGAYESNGQMTTFTVLDATGLSLNHGMALSRGYLYASSDTTVYRWPYVDGSRTLIQAPAEMVVHNISASGKGGAPFGHFTRTLAFSPDHMLYVSVGSLNNVDNDSYRARVRRCDPSQVPQGGFDYDQMEVWADGLRNGVAIAFDNAGRLWEADNGPDNLKRDDLSPALFEDNPSEEINLLSGPAGAFYGYPYCWTAYNIPNIPRGTQLAWPYDGNLTDVKTDDWCQNTENNRPPLGFLPPHSSPIGARFYNGSLCTKSSALGCEFSDAMFVTLHGSWNPTVPHGFQVMAVPMNGTQPGIPIEIFSARDYKNRCTGDVALNECFRPAGIAFDPLGRLWVSSDSTGDVVMIATQEKPSVAAAGLSEGALAGIIAGSALLIILLGLFLSRKYWKQDKRPPSTFLNRRTKPNEDPTRDSADILLREI